MRKLLGTLSLLPLIYSYAWAGNGDFTVTLDWAAQNPRWQVSKTETGVINSALLSAWQQSAGPNGPICYAIWQAATKLNGAGGCLRNLYQTGNVCQLDQTPAISVSSTSRGVVVSVSFNNNYLKAIYSLQSGPADVCGITQDADGDPQFNITISGVANMVLDFSNNELSVGSFTTAITDFDLGGANNSAGFLITLGNIVGAFNGLKNDLAKTFNFTSHAETLLANSSVSADIADILDPLKAVGVSSSLSADRNGVHLVLTATQCLPEQTPGTFPCDKTTVCLDPADWAEIYSASANCAKNDFGHGELMCRGFPDADERGPNPPDGWFGKGTTQCAAPSASQARAIVSAAQNALGSCQNRWEYICLSQIPGCQQYAGASKNNGQICDPHVVYTSGPCSPAAVAANQEAALKNTALQVCLTGEAAAAIQCQKDVTKASANSCSSQISALNQANQLCSQLNCNPAPHIFPFYPLKNVALPVRKIP